MTADARDRDVVGDLLARLWRDGPGPDDHDTIERVSLVCPDGSVEHGELRTFLAWLEAMEGHPVAFPIDIERRELAAIVAATRLRVALTLGDPVAADQWIRYLEREPVHAFGRVAAGMIDLALVDVGLFAGNREAIAGRVEALAAAGQPLALRLQAMRRAITIAAGRFDLARASAIARDIVTLAGTARPLDAQHGRRLGAVFEALGGRRAERSDDAITELVVAMVETPARGLDRLAALQRRAGEQGDAELYMLCALFGARRYLDLERRVDAWLTVSTALVLMRVRAPEVVGPLEDERERWLAAWGPIEYERVVAKAVAIAKAHGQPAE